ncbi:ATP-binding protein [Streptomyces sp. NPDC048636]|uniref:ATP-binding protein n=1 Tax=Streptomyces sp. NPDC048636 TaxID=3155762 RepID=UPI00341B0D51
MCPLKPAPHPASRVGRQRADRAPAAHGTASHTSRLGLAGTVRPVTAARRHVHDTLRCWGLTGAVLDDALLVASELVANAEQHAAGGGGPLEMRLTFRTGHVIIAVSDAESRRPVCHPADGGAESGRGLAIVRALAQALGCRVGAGRKTVWARLTVPDSGPSTGGAPTHEQLCEGSGRR